jgi:hypothetical protein
LTTVHKRRDERQELRRILLSGVSLQMLAPRRIGKTWLMHCLEEDLKAEGWITAFVDVEGMQTEDEFLRALCHRIEAAGTISERALNHLSQRVRQLISGDWDGNVIRAIGRIDAKEFAEALVASLDAQGKDTLILVDEIALFVMARLREDEPATLAFLYHLRKLRQAYPRVRWLFTGSIGLDVVARRAGLQGALIDLGIFPLAPFSDAAALSYLEELCGNATVRRPFALDTATFAYLAQQIGWLTPYYLKLVGDRIRASGPIGSGGLSLALTSDIENALDELLEPVYRAHFATWEEHLDKNFPEAESKVLYAILGVCCETSEGETSTTILARLRDGNWPNLSPRDLKNMLTALANAGYLHLIADRWCFQSGLLRRYWLRYLHE